MLPTMAGLDFFSMPQNEAAAENVRRVKAYWRHIQDSYPEFREYHISRIFPRDGVRESIRVQCDYMLNEKDILDGMEHAMHKDIIATADHFLDRHGAPGPKRLVRPYGIPFRCLLPLGVGNMLVAGRIAGFSSLAASSCRLSRTMMALGEAAGKAVAYAMGEKMTNWAQIDGEAFAQAQTEF